MKPEEKERLAYQVGALLYTPAIQTGVADKLAEGAFPCLTAMAFCLEDSIQDTALAAAEATLKHTLAAIRETVRNPPLLFVRVRSPAHLAHVHRLLDPESEQLTGYIFPKFDCSNADAFIRCLEDMNRGRARPLFMMPILESKMIADAAQRIPVLLALRERLNAARDCVLNIRVGGNDFSNLYGLRRSVRQNIYQIGVIRDILVDIIRVFAADYVVSGPVWEYFGEDENAAWAAGLRAELELDRLNGFLGKTAVHPCQLPVIFESMKVSKADYADARRILGWNNGGLGVGKSADGSRMNEVKCHGKWARRIALLGELYGLRED